MSLLRLNDFVLLRVFNYLNLKDKINLGETCVRLRQVAEMTYTKYKHFDLHKYVHYYKKCCYDEDDYAIDESEDESRPFSADTVLSHIGKYIVTLSTDFCLNYKVRKAVMDNCVNVKSLKIYSTYNCNTDGCSEWNIWMQKLTLESLAIADANYFNDIRKGIVTLKELKFSDCNNLMDSMDVCNFLEMNPNLECLKMQLYDANFKYDIFTKLPKLRYLDIMTRSVLNMTELTTFKLFLTLNYEQNVNNLNSFLKILTRKAKLDELELYVDKIDENTFSILKSFNVCSLGMYALICEKRMYFTHRKLVNVLPNLIYLNCLNERISLKQMIFLVNNFRKLKTFYFLMSSEKQLLNTVKIDEILKTSINESTLTLYVNWSSVHGIKIKHLFSEGKHHITYASDRSIDSYYTTDNLTPPL